MEDFAGAHEARCIDVDALLGAAQARTTAAAHLGGSAVECRLKALTLVYHGLSEWNEPGRRDRDPRKGMPIARPSHSLLSVIRLMNDLYLKAKADSGFLAHLNRVTHPAGATTLDFIDMRYVARQLTEQESSDWLASYRYVLGWLKKNEKVVL